MDATEPAPILQASVMPESLQAYKLTMYSISLISNQELEIDSMAEIIVPKQVFIDNDTFGCRVSTRPTDDSVACSYNETTRMITIPSINQVYIHPGSHIEIDIYGITNSLYANRTDSFEISLFTKDKYIVNTITSGLSVKADCDFPCVTCSEGKPSECTSCDTTTELFMYFDGTCRQDCPETYYPFNYVCSQCDEGCLACENQS